jgi:hypothetical protein
MPHNNVSAPQRELYNFTTLQRQKQGAIITQDKFYSSFVKNFSPQAPSRLTF